MTAAMDGAFSRGAGRPQTYGVRGGGQQDRAQGYRRGDLPPTSAAANRGGADWGRDYPTGYADGATQRYDARGPVYEEERYSGPGPGWDSPQPSGGVRYGDAAYGARTGASGEGDWMPNSDPAITASNPVLRGGGRGPSAVAGALASLAILLAVAAGTVGIAMSGSSGDGGSNGPGGTSVVSTNDGKTQPAPATSSSSAPATTTTTEASPGSQSGTVTVTADDRSRWDDLESRSYQKQLDGTYSSDPFVDSNVYAWQSLKGLAEVHGNPSFTGILLDLRDRDKVDFDNSFIDTLLDPSKQVDPTAAAKVASALYADSDRSDAGWVKQLLALMAYERGNNTLAEQGNEGPPSEQGGAMGPITFGNVLADSVPAADREYARSLANHYPGSGEFDRARAVITLVLSTYDHKANGRSQPETVRRLIADLLTFTTLAQGKG